MPDASMPEKILPQAEAEMTDVGFMPMVAAGILMLVALAGIVALSAWLYPGSTRDDPHRLQLPQPAGPVLQNDTATDMRAFRAAQMARLDNPGWIDRTAGTVHIPIADAMRDVARTGIPDWPTAPRRHDWPTTPRNAVEDPAR